MRPISLKSIRLWLSLTKFYFGLFWPFDFWPHLLWYKYESTRDFVLSMLPFVPCYITIHLFMDKHYLLSKYDPSVVPSNSNIFQPIMTGTTKSGRKEAQTDARTNTEPNKWEFTLKARRWNAICFDVCNLDEDNLYLPSLRITFYVCKASFSCSIPFK